MVDCLTQKDARVDEVWSLDLINQGDSAILNAGHLGPACELTPGLRQSIFHSPWTHTLCDSRLDGRCA